jgi:hypothetical protein
MIRQKKWGALIELKEQVFTVNYYVKGRKFQKLNLKWFRCMKNKILDLVQKCEWKYNSASTVIKAAQFRPNHACSWQGVTLTPLVGK